MSERKMTCSVCIARGSQFGIIHEGCADVVQHHPVKDDMAQRARKAIAQTNAATPLPWSAQGIRVVYPGTDTEDGQLVMRFSVRPSAVDLSFLLAARADVPDFAHAFLAADGKLHAIRKAAEAVRDRKVICGDNCRRNEGRNYNPSAECNCVASYVSALLRAIFGEP